MIKNKIKILRNKFLNFKIDGYIVPKNDEYFSEYAKNDRLKNISNFSGSAGIVVILKKKNYLFVDGRYTIQAAQESSKNFNIIEIHKNLPNTIIRNLDLGYDPKVFTSKNLKNYFSNNNLIPVNDNLIDQIFRFKEKITKPFYSLKKEVVHESHNKKILKIVNYLKLNNADYLFVSAPENVAWLLNIRGYDNPNSPIPNARLIVDKNKKLFLITKKDNAKKIIKEKKINKKDVVEIKNLPNVINNLNGKKFIIDDKSCSIFYENIIKSKFKILNKCDPIYKLKSIKNSYEVNHMIKAHKKDGLALTRFIYWIKNINKKNITEIEAQNKLERFRKLNKDYLFPSFNTIAGSGSNGAIVHYRATPKTTKKISKKDILLVDSGGQYNFGTTDVTRTICFANQKQYIKNAYTNVLKGHIAVALTDLNKDNTGKKIDINARKFLKKEGLDYAHGTGHGVGFFLNVHEGPQSISKHNTVKIEKGMILSNEPGYYKKNHFGIRIENLVYVRKLRSRLFFENLTLAPVEKDLINYKLLNKVEKDYLFRYHLRIYSEHSASLNKKERKWLASFI
ncbi:aminopeptidase P family protein [Candidatus Pelagibacter sp. Uisw_099_02]|uniref:M24 family metallopeptidase n=1 Tax=Candidatus Pelagibacter sp. Uisw_099_02 TaxID=3230981 RepID=UPI002370D7B0|nr:aminopeptidase family protein P [Candidatus Pelagibacter sp.]|tara:strand:+ start:53 stop:1747 length:1695 start_codon:yes stop_codon:yes gene_type:complete